MTTSENRIIRIALPNKGRLAEGARDLLEKAGLHIQGRPDRALHAPIGADFQALFIRSRDIPEFVADGVADVGITGRPSAECKDPPRSTLGAEDLPERLVFPQRAEVGIMMQGHVVDLAGL